MPLDFEPEIVLPGQLESLRGDAQQPERRLMLAVLEDAVAVLSRHAVGKDVRSQRRVREIERWYEDRAGHGLFAFENICAVLGFDPDALRAGMRDLAAAAPVGGRTSKRPSLARRMSGERHRITLRRSARNGAA